MENHIPENKPVITKTVQATRGSKAIAVDKSVVEKYHSTDKKSLQGIKCW